MKRFPTGLLCLLLVCSAISSAQEGSPQQPAAQQPAQPRPPEPQPPAQTQPPQQEPGAHTGTTRMPPPPPKIVDVRMPGETGWFIGITGWLPVGKTYVDKGKEASFTGSSFFQLPGTSKGQPGLEIGIAAGLHNTIRLSYMFAKAAGTVTAPNDLVLFSQGYSKGVELSSSYKMSDYKISYEYLTWPYPVENRHFRLKTLWQMQYITYRTGFDAPVLSNTPDSAGNLISYATTGSKSYFSPSFGLGVHEYATRNFRFEANASGFALPHHFNLWDLDASVAYRLGKIELRGGARALHFRSSSQSDYWVRGTLSGAFVGVRWYSD